MSTAVRPKEELAAMLAGRWEQVSRKFADLAQALPEGQLESHPVAGTRNAGEVVRHVAFWNRYLADSLRGNPADDTANELPREQFPTKARVLEALQQSAGDVAAALAERAAPLDSKAAELVASFLEHTSEHYGQLAVYARISGVTPPASQ